jgi:ABC-type glycerol-3-phosphate transport system substrate-binding protein
VSKRLLLLPCIAILAALSLAACGSGGDESGEVEEAIETSATTTDPADCKRLETQRFMEQTSGESGKAALQECEEEAEKDKGAESVKVSSVEVDGAKATGDAALQGGTLDGQTVEVALVKDGEQWKLDEVVKFTKFDQGSLVQFFEEQFADPQNEVPPRLANCIIEAVEEGTQGEVEELIFSGSRKPLEEVAESCG